MHMQNQEGCIEADDEQCDDEDCEEELDEETDEEEYTDGEDDLSENDGQYSVEDDPNDANSQWQDVHRTYHHKNCKNAHSHGCTHNHDMKQQHPQQKTQQY